MHSIWDVFSGTSAHNDSEFRYDYHDLRKDIM